MYSLRDYLIFMLLNFLIPIINLKTPKELKLRICLPSPVFKLEGETLQLNSLAHLNWYLSFSQKLTKSGKVMQKTRAHAASPSWFLKWWYHLGKIPGYLSKKFNIGGVEGISLAWHISFLTCVHIPIVIQTLHYSWAPLEIICYIEPPWLQLAAITGSHLVLFLSSIAVLFQFIRNHYHQGRSYSRPCFIHSKVNLV